MICVRSLEARKISTCCLDVSGGELLFKNSWIAVAARVRSRGIEPAFFGILAIYRTPRVDAGGEDMGGMYQAETAGDNGTGPNG